MFRTKLICNFCRHNLDCLSAIFESMLLWKFEARFANEASDNFRNYEVSDHCGSGHKKIFKFYKKRLTRSLKEIKKLEKKLYCPNCKNKLIWDELATQFTDKMIADRVKNIKVKIKKFKGQV